MDPRRFLELAESLVREARAAGSSADTEANCRTAVGRAYYAAFLAARSFVEQLGYVVTETGACHDAVYKVLNNCTDPNLRTVADHLSALGTSRRIADYKMQDRRASTVGQADSMVQHSTAAVDLLAQLLTGVLTYNRPAVIQAIDRYIALTGL